MHARQVSAAVSRRRFGASCISAMASTAFRGRRAAAGPTQNADPLRNRIEGLLLGTLLGDAMGGPVEFDENGKAGDFMPNLRSWPEERSITARDVSRLASGLPLLGYEVLRPATAPYGPWSRNAPAGTITDDTRHKIIMIAALRHGRDARRPLVERDLASAYLEFDRHPCLQANPGYRDLNQQGGDEFRKTARWVLGQRHTRHALPPERIWAGVPTCCGQMTLPPLAAVYAGQPEAAYLASYRLGFFDNGPAKDINAAIIAALSVALTLECDPGDPDSRKSCWTKLYETMRTIDPYLYRSSPFTQKPAAVWVDFALEAARRAAGSPRRLFRILEQECQVVHWWESHLILVTALACAELCGHDPLASMHLVLDFGHDTDSGAALLGAFVGALHGPGVFPLEYRRAVKQRLQEDYLESVDEWVDLLTELNIRQEHPEPVRRD